MTLRMGLAFLMSLAFTGTLFAFMHAMISGREEVDTTEPPARIEFQRLMSDTDVAEKVRVKPQVNIPRPTPTKPTIAIQGAAVADATNQVVQLADALSVGSDGGAFGVTGGPTVGEASGSADRSCIPLVRIDPTYPPQAQERGLEGWVQIHFVVGKDGSVREATAVRSSNKIFERAAIQAALRYKYQPQIVGGQAVECENDLVLRFNIED
jgi:protein TonB